MGIGNSESERMQYSKFEIIELHERKSEGKRLPSDSGFGNLMISNFECCICSLSLFSIPLKRDPNYIDFAMTCITA